MELWNLYGMTILFGAIYALFALSTHTALWAGMLSLASAAFAGVSGYAVIGLAEGVDLPVIVWLVAGAAAGAFAALIVALILLRLDSHWFALGTVAMLLIVRVLIVNIPATGSTGGKLVLIEISPVHVFGSLAFFAYIFARIRRSRLGLAAEAVRRDPDVAASLGIQVRKLRVSIMVLSGAVAGVAGVLFAGLTGYITPDTYYVDLAFVMLAGVVFGGAYYWPGAIVGGFLFAILPDLLHSFMGQGQQFVNGILLLVVILFLPNGVLDEQWIRRWWPSAEKRARIGQDHSDKGVSP